MKPVKNQGFTLIEILIVSALTGMLLAGLFASYMQIKEILYSETKNAAISQQVIYTAESLRNDFANLLIEKWNLKYFFECRRQVTLGARIDFCNFPSGSLYTNPSTLQTGAHNVTWFGANNPQTGHNVLYRKEDIFTDYTDTQKGISVPVLNNINQFIVEFSTNGEDWTDGWSYQARKMLPRKIRVKFVWMEGDISRNYSFEISPVAAR